MEDLIRPRREHVRIDRLVHECRVDVFKRRVPRVACATAAGGLCCKVLVTVAWEIRASIFERFDIVQQFDQPVAALVSIHSTIHRWVVHFAPRRPAARRDFRSP